MKITLENIGKVKNANIEIKGITVIAGENNTGKSTVGKTLWSVFYGLSNIKNGIREYVESSVRSFLRHTFFSLGKKSFSVERGISLTAFRLVRNVDVHVLSKEEAVKKIRIIVSERLGDVVKEDDIERIYQLLSPTEQEVIDSVLSDTFDREFNSDCLNKCSDKGKIVLNMRDKKIGMAVADDAVFIDNFYAGDFVEAVYIDDPFVLDDSVDLGNRYIERGTVIVNHRSHLKQLFHVQKNNDLISASISKKALDTVNQKIAEVCTGDILMSDFEYKIDNQDHKVSLQSLSTGLKMFVLFKQLVQSGNIDYNGILILDEPEIHLHPAWQIKLAEIIVLLQEAFHLHVLLNTHSPYFLEAIETYSEIYGRENICKYYLAKNIENNMSVIREVDHNEEIYNLLADPFRILHSVRYGKR